MKLDTQTLVGLVLAHLRADPSSLRFSPIRTGRHNQSYWVESDQGRFVLRIAPPDEAGFLFGDATVTGVGIRLVERQT